MIQKIKPQGYFDIYCDHNQSPLWGRRDSFFDHIFKSQQQFIDSPLCEQYAPELKEIHTPFSTENIQNTPAFINQSNQTRAKQSLSFTKWRRFDYRQQQSQDSGNLYFGQQNGSISEQQIKFSLENMALNRSRSQSYSSFQSTYSDMKIESSKMKEFGFSILRSDDQQMGEICQIISCMKDQQNQDENKGTLNQSVRNVTLKSANKDDEAKSVKAIEHCQQQSQSLKIKISLENKRIIKVASGNQQQISPSGNELKQPQKLVESETEDECSKIKKKLCNINNTQSKIQQNQEQTKTTAEIEQLQSLDLTSISFQQQALKEEKKKSKKDQKEKKEKMEKRKYTKRKPRLENKPKTTKKPQTDKKLRDLEQIKLIQELLQESINENQISTQITEQEAKSAQIKIQSEQTKLKEPTQIAQNYVPIAKTNKTTEKNQMNKNTKNFKKRSPKPKANKTKQNSQENGSNQKQSMIQDKQNIQPTTNQEATRETQKQERHKCQIQDCTREFSTKQGLSLHICRTHKINAKSQMSIKKAEHQSCKQIYKQIYPEDTRYNPIKLAELKEGMKIQS